MFALHEITITNFRSYRGTHTFEFPSKSGVYYLTGKNGPLGSNGAGKSTLLDAIVWSLYGRTIRGLKAAEVLPWAGLSPTEVTLKLTVGRPMAIKRTQKPNSLTIDGKPVDQAELEKHIRLNFESFIHAVIKPQFGEPFFNLTPTAKLSLFSDIMNLDYWLNLSNEAAMRSKKLEAEIDDNTHATAKHEGALDHLKCDHDAMVERERVFETEINDEIGKLKKVLGLVRSQLAEAIGALPENCDPLRALKYRVESNESAVNSRLDVIQKLNIEKAKTEGLLSFHKEQVTTFQAMKGKCPCCGQKVTKDLRESHIHQLTSTINDCECDVEYDRDEIVYQTERLIAHRQELDSSIDHHNRVFDLLKQERDLTAEIQALKLKQNPYSSMINTQKKALVSTKATIAELRQNYDRLSAVHVASSYWIKGFKRVRLFIIEQTFQTLEIEINNALAQLGMVGWQISLDIERENKSGGSTKGFMVFVQSPDNKEPVRWENWSGGETQRLQLAGDLGLSNLIMTQAGLANTIEFYDEPSTHLSPEGMLDLANMLHDRAVTEHKSIWIVDHVAVANFGDLAGVIEVRKGKNGSEITSMDA